MPVEWDPYNDRMFHFNNGINGIISLPRAFKPLIDTPEFQRLRDIKQLGNALLVFPDADHSRYVHSLGTAFLAYKFMMELSNKTYHTWACETYDGRKLVTGNDILAVTLAALCHDLGHGPFSHMYEEVFAENDNHEALSIKMFNKILDDHSNVKKALAEHFDVSYFELVRQLIDPPPDYWKPDQEWPLAVSKDKAFLFGIVSNSLNGLDVDKFDYLIRDSERSGIPVSINQNVILLLFKTAEIVKHPDFDITWVAFPDRFYDSVNNIFEARKKLHEQLYNHRVIIILAELLKSALKSAGEDLEILGSNNNPIKLKDCTSDLNAYLNLNDSVVDLIKNSRSTEPGMNKAKELIKQITTRKFPRCIAKLDNLQPQAAGFENEVRNVLLELNSIDGSKLITVMKVFHFGKGFHNPMSDVLYYGTKNNVEVVKHYADPSCSRTCLFVYYGPDNCTDEFATAVYQKLSSFAKMKGFKAPTKLFP